MIEFSHQYRSVKDIAHTGNINQMRDTTVAVPINRAFINSLKVLSTEDIDEDPSWAFATIAVCSNAERYSLNSTQVVNYGKVEGLPILRWNKKFNTTKVKLIDSMLNVLYEDEPKLSGFFVKGAPVILFDNLNPSSGLANGSFGVLHSLIFDSPEEDAMVIQLLSRSHPGQIVDVPVPYAIMTTFPGICRETWKHKSLSKTEVVIPLVEKSNRKNYVTVGDQQIKFFSHSYDLAFALTYHKLQGQTKAKVILDLNRRPSYLGNVSFQGAYVGLTRVNFANNMRILPCQDANNFNHLLELRPDPNLTKWLQTIRKIE